MCRRFHASAGTDPEAERDADRLARHRGPELVGTASRIVDNRCAAASYGYDSARMEGVVASASRYNVADPIHRSSSADRFGSLITALSY